VGTRDFSPAACTPQKVAAMRLAVIILVLHNPYYFYEDLLND
jgi:hypothetical protein